MIAAMLLALAATAEPPPVRPSARDDSRCTATPQMLIGAWAQRIPHLPPNDPSPDGDSREFNFVVEGGQQLFREYLHRRPGGDGNWVLSDCRLTLIGQGWRTEYHVVRLNRSSLWLRSATESEMERFERIEG